MGLTLTELIRRVGGDDAIEYQNLLDDLHGARQRKHGVTELSFGTRQITTTEIATGDYRKVALVLWIDKAAMAKAIADWRKEQPTPSREEAPRA